MCVCACVCVRARMYNAYECVFSSCMQTHRRARSVCRVSSMVSSQQICFPVLPVLRGDWSVCFYVFVCVCLPKTEILILHPNLQQHQSSVRKRQRMCFSLSLCVHDYILDLKSILTNKLWVFFCYSEQFLVLCQYFLHLLGWGRKRMGAETEEVILLMRVTLIPWLVHCCRFISPAFALQLYHFSPLLSPYVLLWMKNLPRVPASAMSCILLSPSISVDIFTSLYTPTVTRPCTGRRSIKIVPSNRPMNCE